MMKMQDMSAINAMNTQAYYDAYHSSPGSFSSQSTTPTYSYPQSTAASSSMAEPYWNNKEFTALPQAHQNYWNSTRDFTSIKQMPPSHTYATSHEPGMTYATSHEPGMTYAPIKNDPGMTYAPSRDPGINYAPSRDSGMNYVPSPATNVMSISPSYNATTATNSSDRRCSPPDLSQIVPGSRAPMFKGKMKFKAVRHQFGRPPPPSSGEVSLSKWASLRDQVTDGGLVSRILNRIVSGNVCKTIIQFVTDTIKKVMTATGSPNSDGKADGRVDDISDRFAKITVPRAPQGNRQQGKTENDKAIADEVRRAIYHWH